MLKKVLAIVMILALGASFLWFANPLSPAVKANADTYKGGFMVTASKTDDSGIALDSKFYLTSQNPVTLDFLRENLSIRGQDAPAITVDADGVYVITPTKPLEKNRLYMIDIKTPDSGTVSFAFQTMKDFSVIGSLPENMSTNVPVDTGIEIYFSYPDVSGIDNYFEISPAVKGRFEVHGYAVSFVPDKLDPGTIYKVTVKKGLPSPVGQEKLTEDYTFSFETAPDSKVTADPNPGALTINNNWFDFSTRETPAIPFDLYLSANQDMKNVEVTATVYRFPDLDAFLKAVMETQKYPTWAWYSYSTHKTDVSALQKVLQFKQSFNLEQWQAKYMMLPESLKEGFYIVELSNGDLTAQAFIQSTDIASYMMEDANSRLFWVNSLATGNAESNAVITDLTTGKTASTDGKGLAKLEGAGKPKDQDASYLDLYKITSSSGAISVLNTGYKYSGAIYPDNNPNLYWRYIQTDRTLYKPSDTVEFWGFVKSRTDGTSPSKVTVDISEGGFYPMFSRFMQCYLPFISKPLDTLTLDTDSGFFGGKMALPALDPGSYTLTVKSGDKILATSYISVENYVKPQYKIDVTTDKNAVFSGEKVTFTIQASFFDGTPVANVPVRYSINGWSSSTSGEGTTDPKGILKVEYTPQFMDGMQGECYFNINVSATLPETGEISQYKDFRVFVNDIALQNTAEIKDGKGTVTVQANKVVLDTLNDADTTNDNYYGPAAPGRSVGVEVYRISWEKIETGNEYDFVNKVVRKTYEYREKRELAGQTTLTTGSDGKAKYEFQADPDFKGYYDAIITTKDSNGRSIKYETGIYDQGKIIYPQYGDYYHLKTDKDNYGSGETVNIGFYNNEEPITGGRTLFVESRNGIFGYDVMNAPKYSKAFDVGLSPNYYVDGVLFNGKSYIQSNCVVPYRYEEKKLAITVQADKESYKPGEQCTVKIKAVDKDGKPVAARVNISLVDEALLKLSGQYIDPLGYLYSWIDSGILRYSSNRGNNPPIPYAGGRGAFDGAVSMKESFSMPVPAASEAPKADMNGAAFDTVAVRSDFRDTACFETVKLDKNGEGTLSFKLPDNITSFSLSAAAISDDLHAGSEVATTKVSMPFFLNDAMSTEYLAGDSPYIGVTAYGQELKENENVTFELRCKELSNYVKTVSAKAFERVNIPLPKLSEGTYNIEIYAASEGGLADAVKRTVQVYGSYRTIETSTLNKLTQGMKIDAGKSGLTTLIFTDESRAKIINALHGLAWGYGHRLDQKLVALTAQNILKELLKSDEIYFDPINVDAGSYRNEDGGYGILPYAESDMELTALLAPYLKDNADMSSLKMYFYNAVLSNETINAAALYGLAALGEPVLMDLDRARNTENLSLTDYMLIGMAYEKLGETSVAQEIYTTRIRPQLEVKDPYIRVKVKNGNTDACLEETALLAAFTSGLGMDESDKMYAYMINNYSKNVYTGIEMLMYLTNRLNALPDQKVGFDYSYNGKNYTVDLSGGVSELVKIPSVKASAFKVTKVTGNASVLSLFMAPLGQTAGNDANVGITRKYYNAVTNQETTTFSQNDIVKVVISYDVKKAAIDNCYEISDYAPSGLKPINNPWQYGVNMDYGFWYRSVDGQKVTFVVSKYFDKFEPLVYYARVASPGEYTAEGTVAQGSIVKSSLVVNGNTMIKILP